MRIRSLYIGLFALGILLYTSCELDNYDEPESFLKGRLVYQGEAINVSYNDVGFELWEPGWPKKTQIWVFVDQDGTFSSRLFDATYKLIIPEWEGPFMSKFNDATNSDTIQVVLNGSKTMDIEVMPFYMIRNPSFSVASRTITGTCSVEKIITDANARDVTSVSIYVNKGYFVDYKRNIASAKIPAGGISDWNNVSISVDVPTFSSLHLPDQDYVFVRLGIGIDGREDMLFSPVVKMNL